MEFEKRGSPLTSITARPSSREIDVWRIGFAPDVPVATGREILSTDERARAARFVRPVDRYRYEAAHRALRQILGSYLSMEPAAVRFSRTRFGRPVLEGDQELSFSLTHSGSHILVAVAADRAVGIDVEEHRAFDHLLVASDVFAPDELDSLQRMGPDQRPDAFFRTWVRKEAYAKARGLGLHLDLRSFSIPAGSRPGGWTELREPTDGSVWSVIDLSAGGGFSAALACSGPRATVRFRTSMNDVASVMP